MGRLGFDPWVGKISWRWNSNPLQYFCLENPTDRGAWWATVHGLAKIRTRLRLTLHFTLYTVDRLYVQSLAMFEMECDSLRAVQVYASGSLGFSLSSVFKQPHDLRKSLNFLWAPVSSLNEINGLYQNIYNPLNSTISGSMYSLIK